MFKMMAAGIRITMTPLIDRSAMGALRTKDAYGLEQAQSAARGGADGNLPLSASVGRSVGGQVSSLSRDEPTFIFVLCVVLSSAVSD